jgi:hypothetical protein
VRYLWLRASHNHRGLRGLLRGQLHFLLLPPFHHVCDGHDQAIHYRSGGKSPDSHSGGPGSNPGQVMWDLWWTKRHLGRFSPGTSVFLANHSTNYSTLIRGWHNRPNSGRRDRLCGLVVRVPGYRSRGKGSILGATSFLRSSGSGTESTQRREN